MKRGLFGGSFDPIHFGHINLAIQLFEAAGLDELLVCPAARSPFKEEPIASPEHRRQMVQLAIEGIPHFRLLGLELDRGGLSYTIDTLKALRQQYPSDELYLFLSDESFKKFHLWKEHEEILKLAKPLVGDRDREGRLPTLEISSTEIRRRLKKRLYCGHLIPAKTLDYIQRHHLYS